MVEKWKVKDTGLAKDGAKKIRWAEKSMPVLLRIRDRLSKEKPLKDLVISACLHVTKETAVLVKTLQAGGADVALCGSNPLSTQDDVAAWLATAGVHVYAWRGQSQKDYYKSIDDVLSLDPVIIHDDGADLITRVHKERPEWAEEVWGGMEETTTGVIRLRAMERDEALKFPIIAVNDAKTKRFFDNRYGTGQSTIDGIIRATGMLLAGKNLVVCGYGWCGRGIAMRASGMGANVTVCEVDPVKAMEAAMDGFRVLPLSEAAALGDIFVTATGCNRVIRKEHMIVMKDGTVLANAGHFNVEISIADLDGISTKKRQARPNVEEYTRWDGKKIYLLGEGRLVNLVCAEGHPPEVMDMSFANQALCAEYIVKNKGKLSPKVYNVPEVIDSSVAKLKLETMGIEIDQLTKEQKKYLKSWDLGT